MSSKRAANNLSNLRYILGYIRNNVDNVCPATSKPDTSQFTKYILAQYRRGKTTTDRSEIKALREHSQNVILYLKSLQEQKDLARLVRGVDIDKSEQREAAARYVGYEMPKNAPLNAATPDQMASKYEEALRNRISDTSKLSGVDNMKAQYYGADMLPNLKKK